MEKIDFTKVKLIIFDLDNTIWDGLLSEDKITLFPQAIDVLRLLVDNGIVLSICSKNDFEKAKNALESFGLWGLFVFPSIDWTPKGQRVKSTLLSMGLRDENTIFVDDQIENCKEVLFYNPRIKTSNVIEDFFTQVLTFFSNKTKKDAKHLKLKQYRELEKRETNRVTFKSNQDFLFDSKIELMIHKKDKNDIDRIFEMIHKTNQLNFTKLRLSREELKDDFKNSSNWGTIFVKDKYSDYGLVGFYLLDANNRLKHFLFSCRTIGMGVEQFVYEYLGFPDIKIIEPVSNNLQTKKDLSPWISLVTTFSSQKSNLDIKSKKTKILMKGPCDLSVISGYLSSGGAQIDVEFTFQDKKGRSVEHQNSIVNICTFETLGKSEADRIVNNCPFGHENLKKTKIFTNQYDVVILSSLTDFTIPCYKNKRDGYFYSCGQNGIPLTDDLSAEQYIDGSAYTGGFEITQKQLTFFKEEFEYVGVDTQLIYDNLKFIRERMDKRTVLILTLGSNVPFENETNPVYKDTARKHKELYDLLFSKPIDGMYLVDVNPIINKLGQSAFTNNINHFCKQVYINMAEQIDNIIKQNNLKSFKIKKNRSDFFAKINRFFKKSFNQE